MLLTGLHFASEFTVTQAGRLHTCNKDRKRQAGGSHSCFSNGPTPIVPILLLAKAGCNVVTKNRVIRNF